MTTTALHIFPEMQGCADPQGQDGCPHGVPKAPGRQEVHRDHGVPGQSPCSQGTQHWLGQVTVTPSRPQCLSSVCSLITPSTLTVSALPAKGSAFPGVSQPDQALPTGVAVWPHFCTGHEDLIVFLGKGPAGIPQCSQGCCRVQSKVTQRGLKD